MTTTRELFAKSYPEQMEAFLGAMLDEPCPVCAEPWGDHPAGGEMVPTGNKRIDTPHAVALLEFTVRALKANPDRTTEGDYAIAQFEDIIAILRRSFMPRSSSGWARR